MKQVTKRRFARRDILRGTGGTLLALPALESLATASEAEHEKVRVACIGLNFGLVPQLFFPSETGRDYQLTERLQPLAALRNDFTVFSGLDHGVNAQGGHGGVHAYLSGVLSKNAAGMPEANISLDQKAAQIVGAKTRYPSLQLASGSDPNNLISWSASGVALPPVTDPRVIFELLFATTDPRQRAQARTTLNNRRSVLDLVRTDAHELRGKVGKQDQQKLDRYFDSIRQVEKRLAQSSRWLDTEKPEVDYRLPSDANSLDFIDRVPLYYDLITLAFQTDSTRIATLALADIGRNYGGFDISRGYHQLTHHGKVPEYIKELSVIEQFHMRQFARFLNQLKSIEEPNGKSLLDSSMILFGSGMGNASSHSNKNLPLILAGGGFAHGQHRSYFQAGRANKATAAGKLYVSMLQRFGAEVDTFGTAKGSLSGFEV